MKDKAQTIHVSFTRWTLKSISDKAYCSEQQIPFNWKGFTN